MLRPEPLDIVIILLVAILLFGANRLPESARAMGTALREFKDALAGKETESDAANAKKEVQHELPKSSEVNQDDLPRTQCKVCSKPVRAGMKFCPECGSPQ